VPTVDQAKG